MEAEQSLMLVVLSEFMDSDIKKSSDGKNTSWIKRKSVSRYLNSIKRELMIRGKMGFKEMFRISVKNFAG